ncbi:hypothetical protein OH540_09175 [Streptomyces sp. BPPL-273]|uniref:hypothetical protein n=1 Tax=Streptomyces sp. BPPL-273 TaxID=2987533 RepID=UPI0024AFB04F|nr:hypothetical protein [Streptomyces sp. BPPL-273]WHM30192.1 hypothetical protein OH540_09175 [Streptomyces sp. BPPL-273]
MASYTVQAGEWGVHGITLTASEITTVHFPDDVDEIEVLSHDGAAPIYFTVDGSQPAIEGRASRIIPASISAATVQPPTAGPTVVKLISAGAPKVSVTRT